ncbi:serine/threonine-protein kinase NIM1-like [Scleropages formosus]|uniref:serine/threonine-protein kinase NIM1-like n=1 Tax=Scleropages formosus TaxID=113540 RepID=UPI000636A034|nr:serine/threonine-protein kinase NIM1-like [Scleropages formosus]
MTAVCVTRALSLDPHYSSRWSPQDSSDSCGEEEEAPPTPQRLTPLEQLHLDMRQDEKTVRELTVGRRVGFYKVRGEIGCGNFSRVKLGIHVLTKDKVAIKILDKTRLEPKTQRFLSREISSMERLHHPNIIQLYEVVETLSRLYLVMEYAAGGELHTRISTEGRLSDTDSKIVFSQILAAVKHMHENGVVHRDLKAENVFCCHGGLVKVGDFGFSTFSRRDEMLDTFCGSPPYAAPELFRDERYVGIYVDVWALGVILFFMVTGTMPFRAETVPKLRRLILEGAYAMPPWVPRACRRLIQGLLHPQPSERWALDQSMGCEWLLPVEMPRPPAPLRLDPQHLASARPDELDDEEAEVREALEALGVTAEHIRNNQGHSSRSAITGLYRILLHGAHRRRIAELPPAIMQLTSDPRMERLRAYRHTSKLCTVS